MKMLPAKKIRTDTNQRNLSLEDHLSDTERAAVALFGPGRRWGQAFMRFFKLEPAKHEAFLLNLQVACLFHDIGKANEDFIRAMLAEYFEKQTLRHEHLSAMILQLPEVNTWLSGNALLDIDAITAAVLSHHLKAAPPEKEKYGWGQPATEKSELQLQLGHPEILSTLAKIAQVADLGAPPQLPTASLHYQDGVLASPWGEALCCGYTAAIRFKRKIKRDDFRTSLTLALKAGLIASDSVSSGLFRVGQNIETWVAETMGTELSPKVLGQAIIEPRLKSISKDAKLLGFQVEVAKQGPRCLLLSACGSGKTLAAWAWAQAQMETHSLGRVVFLYPTRGTATEGYRDYAAWAPEGDADLMHGTASYELQDMASNPVIESIGNKKIYDESAERLFALGHWSRRYIAATTDQFLSFMENRYSGLCMVPVLADSALIIDEVHSYDPSMFRSLISFLKHFDGPVLCMTATLPKGRQEELAECGLKIFPDASSTEQLKELKKAEEAPRYKIEVLDSASDADGKAVEAYRNGLRVLYVVNTVSPCQETATRLEKVLGTKVLTYHSRFRLMDRKNSHESTVRAFQQCENPVVAVTTQVCEMSLDLDADVLITETAPVSSLVQRFGRANRKLKREYAWVYTFAPPSHHPYDKAELCQSGVFLRELNVTRVSQAELAGKLIEHAGDQPTVDDYSAFVNSGYYAISGDFRDIDSRSDNAILDSDLAKVIELQERRKPWDQYVLPVPKSKHKTEDPPSCLPPYIRIAPSSNYSVERGFDWENPSL
ncbi:MAG: CRISPR-associated helicase Cas3' [Kofleriaceae bacterium]|nr:CRISPR-associated helicase Cas3' [Kofleriaceae bacterium]